MGKAAAVSVRSNRDEVVQQGAHVTCAKLRLRCDMHRVKAYDAEDLVAQEMCSKGRNPAKTQFRQDDLSTPLPKRMVACL